jgi:hypothetical protein
LPPAADEVDTFGAYLAAKEASMINGGINQLTAHVTWR